MLSLKIISNPIDQLWSIKRVAEERPPRTWEKTFKDAEQELIDISGILEEQERTYGPFYPLKKDIFAAFNFTPLRTVKVVIIGQDPYPQSIMSPGGFHIPRAQGLAFSVSQHDAIPSSLQNIYKELLASYRGFEIPSHGNLQQWTKQGVLLLNSCLSVRQGNPGSHGDIWLGFIKKVCKSISITNPNCIYLMWGKEAQKLKPLIGEKSVVLEAAHPSGLSANRGFFGCNHFNMVNEILIKQGKTGINWAIRTNEDFAMPIDLKAFTDKIQLENPK